MLTKSFPKKWLILSQKSKPFFKFKTHVFLGTFAIISIMSSNAAQKLNALPMDFAHKNISNGTSDPTGDVDYTTLEVLTSLCMLTGIFQVSPGDDNLTHKLHIEKYTTNTFWV